MKNLLTHLDWLDDQGDAMLTRVEQLCNVNSGTHNLSGLAKVGQMLVDDFSHLDARLEWIEAEPFVEIDELGHAAERPLAPMLYLSRWPDAKKRVALCIHRDTVYGPEHSFQTCSRLENGHLNGPGVADAKGGLVVMRYALETLERSPLAGRIGWDVLVNGDEEIGSPGSQSTIQQLAEKCDFGLLFEPTLPDGTLVSWRKGSGSFTYVIRGRSAHAGRDFESGRNAIVSACQLATRISDLNTDPEVTYNVGRIRGGGPLNMVPELAILRINVRVKTVPQQATAESKLENLVQEINGQDGIVVESHSTGFSPPKPESPGVAELKSQVERSGEALGMDIHWRGTGGTCDGNKFAGYGLPNIDTLGPCGGNIHSSDEFLIPESLVPRAKLAALVLLNEAITQD